MADVIEKVARRICSEDGSSGFCSCVGESLGCKVGRGQSYDGTNCKASTEQLQLSGYTRTARLILNDINARVEA